MNKNIKKVLGVVLCTTFFNPLLATESDIKSERLKDYTRLSKAIATVEDIYVDKLEFSKIIDKTISGLLSDLDSHSSFMDKKKYKEFKESTSGGDFGGIGVSVGMKEKLLTVIAPIEGTPGEKIGLKSGDKIVKIDDVLCLDDTLEEAIGKIRGKAGTDVKLTVVRKGEDSTLDFLITREKIRIKSVKSKFVEESKIAYIKVATFDNNAVSYVRTELNKYKDMEGIILDLRNNPGGLLTQAVGMVDLFIDDGLILQQKGRTVNNNEKFLATKGETFSNDIPLVILVNNGSASASEIVSGALQEHKRAIVVGKQTFGKGSVQSVIPFSEGEALKVTVARYFLANDKTIQTIGVTPNIVCNAGEVLTKKSNGMEISEKDLKNHLKVDELIRNLKDDEVEGNNYVLISEEDILKDNQLNTAINTVKTIIILEGV